MLRGSCRLLRSYLYYIASAWLTIITHIHVRHFGVSILVKHSITALKNRMAPKVVDLMLGDYMTAIMQRMAREIVESATCTLLPAPRNDTGPAMLVLAGADGLT